MKQGCGGIDWMAMAFHAILMIVGLAAAPAIADEGIPAGWRAEWARTDFSRSTVDLREIMSGGPPRDGIPAIDAPYFRSVSDIRDLAPDELVIAVARNDDVRAYPLRVMMWHEIVNDVVGDDPIAVTYCPLCNAALVFDRRLDGRILDFGTTGKLLHSDLVMYDRQTESWWQQFLGEAIVGELAGASLRRLTARLESWESFRTDHPQALVLVPRQPRLRDYGRNPYAGYDGAPEPLLFRGALPKDIAPMAYVVAVGDRAWSLALLRETGRIEDGDVVLTWRPGASSALDRPETFGGRDLGNVVAYRIVAGQISEIPYDLVFAFVFHAFHPEGVIKQ